MSELPGVDYPWQHPGGAALKAAGKAFACRYLSHDPSKNLTRTEADDLAAHGVWAVLVWETTANRAGAGRAAGVADAKTAEAQAAAAGMPSVRPIYFAVDYDAVPSAVDAYFQGVVSVIGLARTGVYGGYRVVKHLRDNGLVSWIWQTTAWSGGQWDPRANLRQPLGTVRINGADCDIDTAHTTDYGQWMPGHTPITENDMPLTQADADLIVKTLMDRAVDDPTTSDNSTKRLVEMLWDTGRNAGQANTTAGVTLTKVNGLAVGGVDLDALAAKVADLLAARLKS